MNLNHIVKRRPIYTSYQTPTATPLPTCVCLYQYVKYHVHLVEISGTARTYGHCHHNAPYVIKQGANCLLSIIFRVRQIVGNTLCNEIKCIPFDRYGTLYNTFVCSVKRIVIYTKIVFYRLIISKAFMRRS